MGYGEMQRIIFQQEALRRSTPLTTRANEKTNLGPKEPNVQLLLLESFLGPLELDPINP